MNVASAVGSPPQIGLESNFYPQDALATLLQQDWSQVPDVGVENPVPPVPFAQPILEVLEEQSDNAIEPIEASDISLKHDPQRRYKPYGTFLEAFYDRSKTIGFCGPAGCVAGETRIYLPLTNEHIPIADLCKNSIAPIVQTLWGARQAEIPFRKGIARLYRVKFAEGQECVVTDHHVFLTAAGWKKLSEVVAGEKVLVECDNASKLPPNGQHCTQTVEDFPAHCSTDHCFCDAQLLAASNNDQERFPSQADAHVRSRGNSQMGVQGDVLICSLPASRSFDRLSMPDYLRHSVQMQHIRCGIYLRTPLRDAASYQCVSLFRSMRHLAAPLRATLLRADNMRHRDRHKQVDRIYTHNLKRIRFRFPTPLRSCLLNESVDTIRESLAVALRLDDYNFSSLCSSPLDYTVQWGTLLSVEYEKTDEFYDIHVPQAEHYFAEGILHHNTGKSRGILEKLHLICEKYRGARILIVRQTRESLSEAAMMTYEMQVLPEGHYLLNGALRSHRQKHTYATTSEIIWGGLDKPGKMMSTEYDIIYIQEGLDVSREDVDTLKTRLRSGTLPYQQLLIDYNPGDPMHWIHQAVLAGEFKEYTTVHEDNPILWEEAPRDAQVTIARILEQNGALGKLGEIWPATAPDGRRGRWTERGVDYIKILDSLTGARKLRLRYGIWATAEGAVYEDYWNRDINLIKRFDIPATWRRVWIVDFGFTSPFVLHMWAIDPFDRMILYREIYYTRRQVKDHAKQALEQCGYEFNSESGYKQIGTTTDTLPECVVCDIDAEGRETFEQETGIRCVTAFKSSKVGIDEGIQATQRRLKANSNGQARLYIMENCVVERDPTLKDKGLPQCTVEEIDGYVWDTTGNQRKGERPLGKNDHGMDCMRYGVCYIDNIVGDMKAADVVAGAEEPYPGMVVAVPGFRENSERVPRRVETDHDGIRVKRHDDGVLNGSTIGGRRRASGSSRLAEEYAAKTGHSRSGRFGR